MYTVYLDNLRMIHDYRLIAGTWTDEIKMPKIKI
jgi:hypothetical protein